MSALWTMNKEKMTLCRYSSKVLEKTASGLYHTHPLHFWKLDYHLSIVI